MRLALRLSRFSDTTPASVQDADIIISSTASPLPIIGKGMVERACAAATSAAAADVAVPRDVEPEAANWRTLSIASMILL